MKLATNPIKESYSAATAPLEASALMLDWMGAPQWEHEVSCRRRQKLVVCCFPFARRTPAVAQSKDHRHIWGVDRAEFSQEDQQIQNLLHTFATDVLPIGHAPSLFVCST